ncbi:glycosyl hydrolase family 17 protein [Psychroserpens sp. SPM9]|uniref:glycosyl hydrolase family 17 protein n=1 Tax=Psychroserpens sp. SPM9 TaxID=2975598 RepID=UPI0021A527B7|nr:glycosyl hydrolase family 17 protein [Psychroserpens sp. SPM9]MDG5491343.1 glycosyl hydrolase family 17 protein [Psychroserpens sp. SPM9]
MKWIKHNLKRIKLAVSVFAILLVLSCQTNISKENNSVAIKDQSNLNAKDILGNPKYVAISYGGYRTTSRDDQPSINDLKEDMLILNAMGVKILRTYNVHLDQAANVLEAIRQLKDENADFEMYVMLGIWIDCKNAFNWDNVKPDHNQESERNPVEVQTAVMLAKKYPEIVKILAVGNEAMVKWATAYYVQPGVILKWVNHLQALKKSGELPKDLWITSSDNFASWGGGDSEYHVADLEKLIHAVDYISMHTYPMHDTHYHPVFWGISETETKASKKVKIDSAMLRAKVYAMSQYEAVKAYVKSLGVDKPIHIGETGWASFSGGLYGNNGSKATDEYKEALYYQHMREWTNKAGMSCFYFEAFDEHWKDAENPKGSENHFGLFTIDGKAKYALWDLVDKGLFKGLTRNGNPITKTYNGNLDELMKEVMIPELKPQSK